MLPITDRWRPDHRRDAFLARLLAPSLDRKLAAGCSPWSHRLLGIRAQVLVAPETRGSLAQTLEEILESARGTRRTGTRRVRLCRDRIMAAESDLWDMIARLSQVPSPPARAVAMVTSLLRDGAGPLYNPNSTTDLRAVVRQAVAATDRRPAEPIRLTGPAGVWLESAIFEAPARPSGSG